MKITKVVFDKFLAYFEAVMNDLRYLPEVISDCVRKLKLNRNLIVEGMLLEELGNATGLFLIINKIVEKFKTVYNNPIILKYDPNALAIMMQRNFCMTMTYKESEINYD